MTPAEKADKLIIMYGFEIAKSCVIEIRKALFEYGQDSMELQNMESELRYWHFVENEINKLKK